MNWVAWKVVADSWASSRYGYAQALRQGGAGTWASDPSGTVPK